MSIVLVDCYDSFTYNIVHALGVLGEKVTVVRCDDTKSLELLGSSIDGIILGPGPGHPEQAGCLIPLVRALQDVCPILGVCLGHQAIAVALGGSLIEHSPVHGHATEINHDKSGLFVGLSSPLHMTRYHSLVVDSRTLPHTLNANAWSQDQAIMGLSHKTRPIHGVQFHPESVLSGQPGLALLGNFVRIVRRFHHVSKTSGRCGMGFVQQ